MAATLDLGKDALDEVTRAAIQFSNRFGESSVQFVGAAYDIQSAMDGLKISQLAGVTNTSAILAKATKADTGTITKYMGVMYNVFKDPAQKMGVDQWAEQVAGMTSEAVKMFSTDGVKMADGFSNLGASATTMGVSMEEQIAILGKLQGTLSGSQAATKYQAFLSGVGKAQKDLGLTFVDQQGKMLPMVDILNKIKGKYGNLNKVADSDLLKKAFGTKEAVALIKLIGQDIDGLDNSISILGNNRGMDKVIQRANKIADPWEKASRTIENVRIKIGLSLLPILNPLMDKFAAAGDQLTRWMDMFPHLTQAIGKAGLAAIGLVAGLSSLALIAGSVRLAMIGLSFGLGVLSPLLYAVGVAVRTLKLAMLGLNIAMRANPIGLVITALAALAVGAVYVYQNWESLKKSFTDSAWGQGVIAVLREIKKHVDILLGGFKKAFELGMKLKNITGQKFDSAKQSASHAWQSTKNFFGGKRAYGGPVSAGKMYQVNEIVPELLINKRGTFLMNSEQGNVIPMPSLDRKLKPSNNSVRNMVNNMSTTNNRNNGINLHGDIYITAERELDPHEFEHQLRMLAG